MPRKTIMDPMFTFSLASSILKAVDFSFRLVSRAHELYKSPDGLLEDHAILDNAANRLSELYEGLEAHHRSSSRKATAADRRIDDLTNESLKVVGKVHKALEKARVNSPYRTWRSVYQAVRGISKNKEISNLANQLGQLRKEIDTALLVSLWYGNKFFQLEMLSDKRRENIDQGRPFTQGRNSLTTSYWDGKHAELFEVIRQNNWRPEIQSGLQAFTHQFETIRTQQTHDRFCRAISARLYFQQLPDRSEAIRTAYAETFEWLFDGSRDGDMSSSWRSFSSWLAQDDNNLYWISGKPGSGKSTLMKFLYAHPRSSQLLSDWAGPSHLTKAAFYLWNSGSMMQMSRHGLFQALLYECLRSNPSLMPIIFPQRWEQFDTFGGGQGSFEWPELKRSLQQIVSDQSRKFFFLIDGLDEYDGEPKEIIELILGIALPNVKLCVASRPWLPFGDAFKKRPSLLLEELTRQDISKYVTGNFQLNPHFLRQQLLEPAGASTLLQQIVEKAMGVFLWVYLVVRSLLEGLSNADHLRDLQTRLDALPDDLEALLEKLLRRLQPEYFRQACEAFRLIHVYREVVGSSEPSVLALYYADDVAMRSSHPLPLQRLDWQQATLINESMCRRVNARCKGLLETYPPTDECHNPRRTRVRYFHRTARDFIESENFWPTVLQNTGHDTFQSEKRWACAHLAVLQTDPYPDDSIRKITMANCCAFTVALQKKSGLVQRSLCEELRIILHDDKQTKADAWSADNIYAYLQLFAAKTAFLPVASQILAVEILLASPTVRKKMLGQLTDKMDITQQPLLKQVFKYYTAPRHLQWMLRKPELPAYE